MPSSVSCFTIWLAFTARRLDTASTAAAVAAAVAAVLARLLVSAAVGVSRSMRRFFVTISITGPVPAVTLPVGLGYTVTRKRLLTRASKVSRISVVVTGSGEIWATCSPIWSSLTLPNIITVSTINTARSPNLAFTIDSKRAKCMRCRMFVTLRLYTNPVFMSFCGTTGSNSEPAGLSITRQLCWCRINRALRTVGKSMARPFFCLSTKPVLLTLRAALVLRAVMFAFTARTI
mmetsp:Transcript_13257/g.23275  ORF Transcript_13257/g.23275 Transcript_13257/m.23275 type:complete len:233 (-) Transcript_13257:143-841(-)